MIEKNTLQTVSAVFWIALLITVSMYGLIVACRSGSDDSAGIKTTTTSDVLQSEDFDLITDYQESYPKYFLDADTMAGLCIDIIRAIEKESGLRIGSRTEEYTPFRRLQAHLDQGEIDIFVGMKPTPRCEEVFDFLEPPVYSVRSVLVGRMEDSLSVRAVEDLRGETVMAPEGSATAQELRTDYPFIRVDEGGDVFTCLKKLMRNRHRFIVYHDIGLFGAINALELEDQVRAFLVLDQYEHYVAVRKTLPDDVKKRIEQALNTLREQGRLAAISASYIHNAPVREQ